MRDFVRGYEHSVIIVGLLMVVFGSIFSAILIGDYIHTKNNTVYYPTICAKEACMINQRYFFDTKKQCLSFATRQQAKIKNGRVGCFRAFLDGV